MADTETLDPPAPLALPLTRLDTAFATFLNDAQPSPDAGHRLLAALTSHQFGRGHACLDLEALQAHGVGALGWTSQTQSLLPADLVAGAQTLPWAMGANSPLVLDGPRLYLRRNWSAEQSIQAAVAARLQQRCPEPDDLGQALDQLFPGATHCGAPDWQKIACALATRARLTLITGGPGTGKTTTVVRLLALLQSEAVRQGAPLRIALAAPTGKAAARLGESIASAVKRLPEAKGAPAHISRRNISNQGIARALLTRATRTLPDAWESLAAAKASVAWSTPITWVITFATSGAAAIISMASSTSLSKRKVPTQVNSFWLSGAKATEIGVPGNMPICAMRPRGLAATMQAETAGAAAEHSRITS